VGALVVPAVECRPGSHPAAVDASVVTVDETMPEQRLPASQFLPPLAVDFLIVVNAGTICRRLRAGDRAPSLGNHKGNHDGGDDEKPPAELACPAIPSGQHPHTATGEDSCDQERSLHPDAPSVATLAATTHRARENAEDEIMEHPVISILTTQWSRTARKRRCAATASVT